MINEDLKPFWKVSPEQLLKSINHASNDGHLSLRKGGFTKGQYHGQGGTGDWIVDDIGSLLAEISAEIADVEFAINVLDEPREIIFQQLLDAGGTPTPEFQDLSRHSIWDQVVRPCKGESADATEAPIYDYGISFIQSVKESKNVCRHPEFKLMHGLFTSPTTCIITDAPVPILSQAAPSSFGDIMYPSPWYAEKYSQEVYKEHEDLPWEEKANTLYWAGCTTGSHSTNGSWTRSHRQRFVSLIQDINSTAHTYMYQTQPGIWEAKKEIMPDMDSLFDVKFTDIIQCDPEDCKEEENFFQLGEREDFSKQYASRFIFDLDGNSFSRRYYTLLQSKSVVLKQTVLREWHDERLIPWVHYVPVSLGMEELPEIMRWMTGSEEGQRRANEIADQSREWQKKVLRSEDFTIYLYRLMIELARILDPGRDLE